MKNLNTIKRNVLASLFAIFMTGQLFSQESNLITLDLLNPTYPTTFNFIGNGYWDKTYNDVDYTWFTSQNFSFSHLIEGLGSSWGGAAWNGFTVCNSGDNENHNSQGWIGNYEWGCMAGGGIKTDAQGNVMLDENGDVMVQKGIPYLVGYWNYMIEPEWWDMYGEWSLLDEPTHCFQILLDDNDEYEAVGVYVNIHPWTYYSNLYGSGPARPLNQAGDHFTLIIHGLNPDGSESGKSVEHIFAKYENSQLTQSAKWEWVDLSSLGEIGGFYCTLSTTVANGGGPVAPMYFCMDKLQIQIKGTSQFVPVTNIINVPNTAIVGTPLTLTGTVIPANATNQTIVWSVKSAGTTGAVIVGNILNTTGKGTVSVEATIVNGSAVGEDYKQEFTIVVIESGDIVPVTNITDVPNEATVGVPLTLTGTVIPENATNQTITWSVKSVGTTGAIIIGNILNTTGKGTVSVEATIVNGKAEGVDYVQEFNIAVTEGNGIVENEFGKLHVYSHLNSIFIKNEANVAFKSVEIFDMAGRLVYRGVVNGYETIITFRGTSGIYNVRLVSQKNTTFSTKLWLQF